MSQRPSNVGAETKSKQREPVGHQGTHCQSESRALDSGLNNWVGSYFNIKTQKTEGWSISSYCEDHKVLRKCSLGRSQIPENEVQGRIRS